MTARSRIRARRLLLPPLLALLGTAACAAALAFGGTPSRITPAGYVLTAGSDFGLSGSVVNLTPGVTASLVLRATNPYSQPITVTTVTATLPAAPAGCPAGELSLSGTTFAGRPPSVTVTGLAGTVPARGSAAIRVPILLARSAGNQCQDRAYEFAFSGTATTGLRSRHPYPRAPCGRARPALRRCRIHWHGHWHRGRP